MSTTYTRARVVSKWRTVRCPSCGGGGLVSAYTIGGTDFLGADECNRCANGDLWILPSDHTALYPGGPFAGKWPGAYKDGKPVYEITGVDDATGKEYRYWVRADDYKEEPAA